MNKYLNFCKKCMDGKMDQTKNYYVLDSDDDFGRNKNNNNVEVSTISPTQAAVEQAKSEIREQKNINRPKSNQIYQIGGKGRSNGNSKGSSKKKMKKIVKKGQKNKKKEVKGERSKKGDKKFKKKIASYRSIWM